MRKFVAIVLTLVVSAAPAAAAPSRSSVSAHVCAPGYERRPVDVVYAMQLIRTGTMGSTIIERGMAQVSTYPCADTEQDAFHKLTDLKGRTAIRVIYPGQRLVRMDFTAAQAPTYRIDHVTDGDTVVLRNGQKVRLVQIDTPEIYFGTECYGPEASATTKRLLPVGTRVRLLAEPATDRVDDYGRLLRYVIRAKDGVNVNIRLVAVGAAAPYFYKGRLGRYANRLEKLALRAKAKKLGLWGACPHTIYDPFSGVQTRR